MRSVSIWLCTTLAITVILIASWIALADSGVSAGDLVWPVALLVATGIGFTTMMLVWALGKGREIVAPVIVQFDALLLVIGIAFATGLVAVGQVADSWPLGGHRLYVIMIAVLTFCLGWISSAIGRNRLIGFRTPRTLADEQVWQHDNRIFGRALMWVSPLTLLALLAGTYGPLFALTPLLAIAIAFFFWDARARR